jgi:hypothetical protein
MDRDKIIEVMAKAIRNVACCGGTVGDEHVFCDDNRLEVTHVCDCKEQAREALKALSGAGYFMCQANDMLVEPAHRPSGSSSERGGEAEELLAWATHTIRTIKDRSCGERHPYWNTPEAVSRSRMYIADHCDAVLPKLNAALSQRPDEEAGTADERSQPVKTPA